MSATPPDLRRFSIGARRLLWIATALIAGIVSGLILHYKLDYMQVPVANRVSVKVPGASASTLFSAINDEDVNQVSRLIDAGADVNSRDTDWETPLMRAAFGGEPGIVERLLSAGSGVSARDKSGRTALHFAAEWHEESPQIVAALVAAGAAIDATDDDGQTPLMLAARGPSILKLKILLANGANPNAADHGRCTPLIHSVSEHTDARHLAERVQLLLDHGADPNAQTKDGQTALDLASQQLELYSNPDFTGTTKALLTGARDHVLEMDLDPEMAAEMRKTFAAVTEMTRESTEAAQTNYPIVVRILRELTKQRTTEKNGPDP